MNIDLLVNLATRSLSHNRHYSAEKDSPKLHRKYTSILQKIASSGNIEFFESGNSYATYAYFEGFSDVFMQNMGELAILMSDQSDQCVKWVSNRIRENRNSINPSTHFDLPSSYAKLLPHLLNMNFHINAVELIGSPEEGYEVLKQDSSNQNFSDFGIELGRLESKEDIDSIIRLKANYFREHPEFCWFFDRPEIFERERVRLTQNLEHEHAGRYVLRDQDGVIGTFAFDYIPNCWTCGMDFAFHPKIHGKGLGTIAYRQLLQQMTKERVNVYRGSTSNPAVLKLGNRLKREATYFHMRSGKGHFPASHFSDFILR